VTTLDFRTEALLAAFIPSIVFLGIVYSRDRYEREPKLLILKLYAMSTIAIALAIVVESAFRIDLSVGAVTIVASAPGVGLMKRDPYSA
jgi:cytochrome bd-type quinol oxidase subunit 1